MRKAITIILLILFFAVSIFFISSTIEENGLQYHSSQLRKISTKDENAEIINFINAYGQSVVAADVGYATAVITYDENARLEQYFDEKSMPIRRSSGYYAVFREYDDSGNNIRNTYLDEQGNPFVTLSGYAIVERQYNSSNQLISERYYNAEGQPAISTSDAYGKINIFGDDGEIRRTIYIDASDNPVMTKQGYAIISFSYYTSDGPENGKVENEFYFDEKNNPVSLSLGEYGVHKEYDDLGRINVLTYLDADGNPMITHTGYT